ncbi:hypothetical protein CMUS01_15313 [Colletotrichum musicola]|uniref:Uncharacterized protein n=1 Tax=Colletotrichum musicola TaxID=2175873 RepID=A0A8H6IYA2_9PEZI|nr:hypothetical protein CMUS01_15313 [Colletotrichum musicola]
MLAVTAYMRAVSTSSANSQDSEMSLGLRKGTLPTGEALNQPRSAPPKGRAPTFSAKITPTQGPAASVRRPGCAWNGRAARPSPTVRHREGSSSERCSARPLIRP